MIIELKPGLGIFVRADKVNEILISGHFAHVHMESGHLHYVPMDEGGNPYDTAREIMRLVNDTLNPKPGLEHP